MYFLVTAINYAHWKLTECLIALQAHGVSQNMSLCACSVASEEG